MNEAHGPGLSVDVGVPMAVFVFARSLRRERRWQTDTVKTRQGHRATEHVHAHARAWHKVIPAPHHAGAEPELPACYYTRSLTNRLTRELQL